MHFVLLFGDDVHALAVLSTLDEFLKAIFDVALNLPFYVLGNADIEPFTRKRKDGPRGGIVRYNAWDVFDIVLELLEIIPARKFFIEVYLMEFGQPFRQNRHEIIIFVDSENRPTLFP
jgi:hypothetical protein